MIKILLYHGTISSFQESFVNNGIILKSAKTKVDFGKGFYTSDTYDFAERTAITHTRKYNNAQEEKVCPLVLTLEFNDNALDVLSYRRFQEINEEWLRFVLYNRVKEEKKMLICNGEPYDKKDLVIGPIADAGVSSIAAGINRGTVEWECVSLSDIAPFQEGIDLQFSFHNSNALSYLRIVKYDILGMPK